MQETTLQRREGTLSKVEHWTIDRDREEHEHVHAQVCARAHVGALGNM